MPQRSHPKRWRCCAAAMPKAPRFPSSRRKAASRRSGRSTVALTASTTMAPAHRCRAAATAAARQPARDARRTGEAALAQRRSAGRPDRSADEAQRAGAGRVRARRARARRSGAHAARAVGVRRSEARQATKQQQKPTNDDPVPRDIARAPARAYAKHASACSRNGLGSGQGNPPARMESLERGCRA